MGSEIFIRKKNAIFGSKKFIKKTEKFIESSFLQKSSLKVQKKVQKKFRKSS